jgi:membrane associated rhomboid family serine protease
MRRPPPLSELASYPVSAVVSVLAAAVTAADHLGGASIEQLVMTPSAVGAEPWRLVTSALPHGDALHLAFNVYWLWVFGTLIEGALGHVALLSLIVFFAAGSGAAEYATFVGGIGLSGVGYGLFGLLWAARRDRRFAGAVDARTAQLFFFWFLFCIVLTVTDVEPIANVAHGVGWLLGALVGQGLGARGRERLVRWVGAAGITGASIAGAGPLRERVNLANAVGLQTEQRANEAARGAYEAMEASRLDDAISGYERAVEIEPSEASYWYNLAIAYEAKDLEQRARDAFERATTLEPGEPRYRDARASFSCRRGLVAYDAQDCVEAIVWFEDCRKRGGPEGVEAALAYCRAQLGGAPEGDAGP